MDLESILMYWLWIQVLSICHEGNIFLKCDTGVDSGGGCKDYQIGLHSIVKKLFPVECSLYHSVYIKEMFYCDASCALPFL